MTFRAPLLRARFSALRILAVASLVLLVSCDNTPMTPGAGLEAGGALTSSTAPGQVVISQVYGGGGNSGAPYDRDFVELFNRGGEPVEVGGWRIHYASSSGTTWNNTADLPAGAVIEPGQYYLVQMAGGSTGEPLPTPDATGGINLAAASGKVVLTSTAVTLSGSCPDVESMVDRVNYGAGDCAVFWGTTPNLSNTTAALRNDDGCAYTANVADDFTRDAPAPRNSASPLSPCAAPDVDVAAVTVDPSEASVHVGATQAFAASAEDQDGEPASTVFTWSSSDEAIATVNETTGLATAVGVGTAVITATAPNGVSGAASLEVTEAPPVVAPDVVISQVYGGGGNSGAPYDRDYVELFNRGKEAVDLTGWSVQYASSSGTSWQVNTLGAGAATKVIQPGGYYLVHLAGGTSGGDALPAADDTGGTNMAATNGKVVLALPGTALSGACPDDAGIVDRVNFGSANCAALWGTTPSLSNTTAALRNDEGCAYTADVSADFVRGPPAPRNSSSPTNDCLGGDPQPVEPTGLVVTEFLADPVGPDVLGEWFELFNAGSEDVNLLGWHLYSRSSTGLEAHTISSSVIVPANSYVVLGNNADHATNGGVNVAYQYTEIILNNSNTDWFTVKRPDGTLEDSVSYSARNSAGDIINPQYFPAEGASRVLIDINLDNSVAASSNWKNSTAPFGDGRNLGSPGWGTYGVAGPVASVVVVPETTAALVGGSVTFSSLAIDGLGNVSDEALSWSSADPSIATVNAATGVATGVAEGHVQIIATASSGVQGSATLSIVHPDAPASVTAGVADPNWVPVGYTKRVFATVRNLEGNVLPPEVTWSVNDPSLGYFENFDGRVYFYTTGAGTAWLTATTSNGVSGSRSLNVLPGDAPTPAVYRNHLEFGMPTPGGGDDDIIVEKSGHVSSFSISRGGPNWVSWNLNATHFGSGVPRCNCFSPDPAIPFDERTVVDSDYIGSGYDRGHMVQSESRTTTEQENAATYWFTNILPQAPDNNQGSWYSFESYTNNLARVHGKEVYIIAGGEYSANPQTINNAGKIQIPEYTWKIAVVMEAGQGLEDIYSPSDYEVIAVRMPNLVATAQRNAPWQDFVTTVEAIEAATGYDLLHLLDARMAGLTATGSNVEVQPNPATTITFSEIEGAGITTVTSSTMDAADAPANIQLGEPATYYNITTTASFSGTVTICIDYSGVSYPDESMLKLMHHRDGEWKNITTSVNTSTRTVCGETDSFSAFLVAQALPIRFESSTNAMTNSSSGDASRQLVIGRPSGVAAGNLLLAQVTFEKGTDARLTAPEGWTLVRRTDRLTDLGQAVFYRVATSAEPASYTWTFSQAVKAAGGIARYSGVDTDTPIVISNGGGGDSSTLTAPGVEAEANSMLVSFYGFKKKDTTLTVPEGMSGRYNFQNPQDVTIRSADEARATAGATGNRVSTPSPRNSDKWVAQSIVLRWWAN